jgi:hypothetical protein
VNRAEFVRQLLADIDKPNFVVCLPPPPPRCSIPPSIAAHALHPNPNDPPGCEQCGGQMIRTGDCFTCPACGSYKPL